MMENGFVLGRCAGLAAAARRASLTSATALLRIAFLGASFVAMSAATYSLVPPSIAHAKDGGSRGGGNSGSGGSHDSGGGGSSGSGGGGSSGSGSGGSHDGSGSDHDSGGHGSDDSGGRSGPGGGDDGGKDSGDDNSGKQDGGKRNRLDDGVVGKFLGTLKSRGRVVGSSTAKGSIEVRYADGWSERVKGSTYSLIDPRQRNVVSRPARKSDIERLEAAID